jgi:hypothetical protein
MAEKDPVSKQCGLIAIPDDGQVQKQSNPKFNIPSSESFRNHNTFVTGHTRNRDLPVQAEPLDSLHPSGE